MKRTNVTLAKTTLWVSLTVAVITLLLLFARTARADTPPRAPEVTALERRIADDGWSVQALRELGEAYTAAGDHGHAVLALERARLVAPRDEAVAAALQRARENAGLPLPRESRVDRAIGTLSPDEWTWIAVGGLAFAGAGLVLIAWSTRRRRAGWSAAVAGVAIGLVAGGLALHTAPSTSDVIIVVDEPARIAPFAAADPAFPARAGERARIEQSRGEHVYVRVDAERAGWLPSNAVEPLIPDRRLSRGQVASDLL